MPDRMEIRTARVEGLVYARVSGVIDEDNGLEEATQDLREGEILVVDCSKVRRINSCGVRDWVNWLMGLEARSVRIILLDCSVEIVEQINMVHNFVGSGKIKSIYAPFYCDACDEELIDLLEVAEIRDPSAIHPPCPSCGRPTELDHVVEQYFAFLEDRDRITLDPDMALKVSRAKAKFYGNISELEGAPRQALPVDGKGGVTPASNPDYSVHSTPASSSLSSQWSPPSVSSPGVRPPTGRPQSATRGSPPSVPAVVPARPSSDAVSAPSAADVLKGLGEQGGFGVAPGPRPTVPPPPPMVEPAVEVTGAGLPGPVYPSPTPRDTNDQSTERVKVPQDHLELTSAGGDDDHDTLSPVATAALVAGIVIVLALMFIVVFRSW